MLIEKYTKNWIKNSESLKNELKNRLYPLVFDIQNVGSTAVPNLDSKPIIDIDIIYSNYLDFQYIKLILEKLGYSHNGNQGIDGREVF